MAGVAVAPEAPQPWGGIRARAPIVIGQDDVVPSDGTGWRRAEADEPQTGAPREPAESEQPYPFPPSPAGPARTGTKRLGVYSRGLRRLPFLGALCDGMIVAVGLGHPPSLDAILGWGCRPSTRRARAAAKRSGIPFLCLEDGLLRSWGTGDRFPPLSIVVDDIGIYHDSTRPSALEALLSSPTDVLAEVADEAARAKALLVDHGLSKYNHAPPVAPGTLRAGDKGRVLVVDQTWGDLGVSLGAATESTFEAMLAAARAENPRATIYVKMHPAVSGGRRSGFLTNVRDDERTVVLRRPVEPSSLVSHMDRVYVVTSTMGFEAVLAGKPVTVFGRPWYAGWGVTDDRLPFPRRTRRRSVDELFAAAYLRYPRYLNPDTHRRGSIFDVIDWLVRQRDVTNRILPTSGRLICVGLRRWKAAQLRPMLSLDPDRLICVRDARAAAALDPTNDDRLLRWSLDADDGLEALSRRTGAAISRIEDGFFRSVGLGSDFIPPLSLVVDSRGLYFDPSVPSDLEHILAREHFTAVELKRAAAVRDFIVASGLTKFNNQPRVRPEWAAAGRNVVLVPGQVEDDASVRYGGGRVRTNLALLEQARREHPHAFLVYKPHPDVMAGNRPGAITLTAVRSVADHVETQVSLDSCIDACDVVHTMTSLSGFEALIRGKRVVTWGQPFYAGWGLTEDRATNGVALGRRRRRLTLDELVAGTLLRYPIYWDPVLRGYTTCESVLRRLLETRDALERDNQRAYQRVGTARRQWRKLASLAAELR